MLQSLTRYLKCQQTTTTFHLHLTVLSLVILQIILSNFIDFNDSGEISQNPLFFYGSWLHIIDGLVLFLVGAIFILYELWQHGIRHFYPYLFGELKQVKRDIATLKSRRLPEAEQGGLAACVQGLGLGALALTLISGGTWYLAWTNHWQWAKLAMEAHETLTGLVIAYIVAHGAMGVLHARLVGKDTRDQ